MATRKVPINPMRRSGSQLSSGRVRPSPRAPVVTVGSADSHNGSRTSMSSMEQMLGIRDPDVRPKRRQQDNQPTENTTATVANNNTMTAPNSNLLAITDGISDASSTTDTMVSMSGIQADMMSESDSSSDGSGTSSPQHDVEGDSVAVNVSHGAGPEVIVKGHNMRKIRVKFPPVSAPTPQAGATTTPRPPTIPKPPSPPVQHIQEEELRMPEEETPRLTPELAKMSMQPWQVSRQQSIYSTNTSGIALSMQSSTDDDSNMLSYQLSDKFGDVDFERKIKQDIIAGISYLESQNNEVKGMNVRAMTEIQRLTADNRRLNFELTEVRANYKALEGDNDELKIQIDQLQREKDSSEENVAQEWRARRKAEEMYAELNRDTEKEIKRLKLELGTKTSEIGKLVETQKKETILLKQMAERNSQASRQTRRERTSMNMDDQFEFLHKIGRLEEEIRRLNSKNESLANDNKKSKDETENMKKKMVEQGHELQTQVKRFLSLKKNFNDLLEENEKLRSRLKVGRNSNSTWPLGGAPHPSHSPNLGCEDEVDGTESLHVLDISLNSVKPPHHLQGGVSKATRKTPKIGCQNPQSRTGSRRNSESRGKFENLPPVADAQR